MGGWCAAADSFRHVQRTPRMRYVNMDLFGGSWPRAGGYCGVIRGAEAAMTRPEMKKREMKNAKQQRKSYNNPVSILRFELLFSAFRFAF